MVGLQSVDTFGGHTPGARDKVSFANVSACKLLVRGILKMVKCLKVSMSQHTSASLTPRHRPGKGGALCPVRQHICHRNTSDPRCASLLSYPSLYDGNTSVQIVMVFGQKTFDHSPRDDAEGEPFHRSQNSDPRKARGAEASPNETIPGIHLEAVKEEDRGARLQPLTSSDNSSQLHEN
ncbi:hypothetical protein BHM03_00011238 [Ensete ventricosum]|nr:hypothetical protein BHM03_00011238 [Ensete ventricosum]